MNYPVQDQVVRNERVVPVPVECKAERTKPKYEQINSRLENLFISLADLEGLVDRIKDEDNLEPANPPPTQVTFYSVYSKLPYQLESILERLDKISKTIEEIIYR